MSVRKRGSLDVVSALWRDECSYRQNVSWFDRLRAVTSGAVWRRLRAAHGKASAQLSVVERLQRHR
jgi:hypothetical protein